MGLPSRLKLGLLAGAALTAAAVTHGAATAPTEPVSIEFHVGDADFSEAEKAVPAKAAKGWAIYAAGAAAFALVARLIGVRRIAAGAKAATAATAKAAGAAARAIAAAFASPFRAALVIASLGLFALAGIGLYDVEWLAGMAFGAIIAAAAATGAHRARKSLDPIRWPFSR